MITAVTPYITIERCEEALNFYKQALGAEIIHMMRVGDGPKEYQRPGLEKKIMHASIKVGNGNLLASDAMGHPVIVGTNNSITLNFETVEETNAAWAKMKDGATIMMDLQDAFWGARFGSLQDKFGVCWMFNCDLKKK